MHVAFLAHYPDVLDMPLPIYYVIEALQLQPLVLAYTVILVVTIVQTSIGVLQGFGDRVATWKEQTGRGALTGWGRAGISGTAIIVSSALSTIGIVDLIARGYGTIAWAFLGIYVIPLYYSAMRRKNHGQDGSS
jgi:uncharacterized membrane protein YkvI